jgi:hypothetical protein
LQKIDFSLFYSHYNYNNNMGKRNIQGGKKTKAMARHDSLDNSPQQPFIHPDPPHQHIVVVTQVLGDSRFLASFHDNKTTIAVLPGKMKGKNKRYFFVQKYSLLLIQLRTDVSLPHKITDILHIYPNHHLPRIFHLFPNFQNIIHSNDSQHFDYNKQFHHEHITPHDTLDEEANFDF